MAGMLRRMIQGLRPARERAAARLARDLGLPQDGVSDILDRTVAEVHKLSSADPSIDARPIIDHAGHELDKLGPCPLEEAIKDRYLQALPDSDYHILRYSQQEKKHSEIAELLGTDVESVRRSLVKTYTGLRLRLIAGDHRAA